jgi:anti-sigma factor RsiW
MTPCSRIQMVHLLFDGELSVEQIAIVETHLRDCAACADELRSLQLISQHIRTHAPQPDAQTLAAIGRNVERRLPSPLLRTAWRLTAAAAVVMALCLTKVSLDSNTSPSRSTLSPWEEAATLGGEPLIVLALTDDPQQQVQWMIEELSAANSPATERRSTR